MANETRDFVRNNWFRIVLAITLMIGTLGMLYLMGRPNLTPRDLVYQSILLALASGGVSFLTTQIYGEWTYSQSLRDRGVQIAAGVMVLKRQIGRLVDWVGQKRQGFQERDDERTDAVLDHVEATLISFQDMTESTLGEIASVIGDALAQYEALMDQISTIRNEAQERTHAIQEEIKTGHQDERQVEKLQEQIAQIRQDTERQISQLARGSVLPIPVSVVKQRVAVACPKCGHQAAEDMIQRSGETKPAACASCGSRFNIHLDSSGVPFVRLIGPPVAPTIMSPDTFPTVAQTYLHKTNAFVIPSALPQLIAASVAWDKQQCDSGAVRTAQGLLAGLLADPPTNATPAGATRAFVRVIYQNRYFRFGVGVLPSMDSPYVNVFDSNSLLKCFVGGSVYKLVEKFGPKPAPPPLIAELLIGNGAGPESAGWVEAALVEAGARLAAKLPVMAADNATHLTTPPAK